MKNNAWLTVRKTIFILLTVFSYIAFIYYLFFDIHYIISVYILLGFLLCIRFFLIELKNYGVRYLGSILLVSAFIEMFLLWFENLFLVFALYIVNIGMIWLVFKINGEINNRKNISSMQMFWAWNLGFAIVCAITYALVLAWTYNQNKFMCQKNKNSNYVFIQNSLDQTALDFQTKSEINNKLNTLLDTKLKDMLGVDSQIFDCTGVQKTLDKHLNQGIASTGDLTTWTNNLEQGTGDAVIWSGENTLNLTWNQKILSGSEDKNQKNSVVKIGLQNITWDTMSWSLTWINICSLMSGVDTQTLNTITSSNQPKKWLFGWMFKLQKNLLTDLRDTRNEDNTVCGLVSDLTKDSQLKMWFSFLIFSVWLIPLFIVFSILFNIEAFVWFILFGIFRLTKMYKYQTIKEEIDDIV